MIENSSVACLFCGSERNTLIGVDEDKVVVPPAATVIIQCLACDHLFAVEVSQATEQVYVGLHKMACPESCTMQAIHQKD
jgi:transcription elongation factor Elf1